MASLLQTSTLISSYNSSSSPSSYCCSSRRKSIINAAIHVPKLQTLQFSFPKKPADAVTAKTLFAVEKEAVHIPDTFSPRDISRKSSSQILKKHGKFEISEQLYMILEAVAYRVEMHNNIGEQRNNWNALLLNSVNMMTLTATTMAGVAATGAGVGFPVMALKLSATRGPSATLMFSAAMGILVVMNEIQPSQLAEEQRNATRFFRQLYNGIQTILATRIPTSNDVKSSMEKVLALDKAYPLPLLGSMLEKFPTELKPACWWPSSTSSVSKTNGGMTMMQKNNGWNEELEMEMREIVQVLKSKDSEDYERLGNLALKLNKILSISGPPLTGIAAVGAAFVGSSPIGPLAALSAAIGGSLAAIVNTLQHGGQVVMVVEMYRNCAGAFGLLEESIESTLQERQVGRRENGQMFEMKVALKLGRSLPQLRDVAAKAFRSRSDGTAIDEFGSKLF